MTAVLTARFISQRLPIPPTPCTVLPPIAVVSDALAISKNLDGIALVVRAGVSEKKLLDEAMRQLKMVNVRILGFVFRDDSGEKKAYKKKYYNYYID